MFVGGEELAWKVVVMGGVGGVNLAFVSLMVLWVRNYVWLDIFRYVRSWVGRRYNFQDWASPPINYLCYSGVFAFGFVVGAR